MPLLGLLPDSLGNVSFINSLLTSVGVAIAALPALLQNGHGTLGLLPVPILPPFLGGPGHDIVPWGNRTANGTNYYEDVPNTGVTRYYDLTIARSKLAPDGYEKNVMIVNGQFPGPTLEANWGDWFEITVHNDISEPEEGTTLHWHGFLQNNTQYYDGVPGVTQCPIAPGKSMTYRFQADLYGTTWYHSHYSAQYSDGVYGPMVVYGPSSANYDIDLGPILVSDFYHKGYDELEKSVMSSNYLETQTTFADGTLIQGKMNGDCASVTDGTQCTSNAGIAKFTFESGKVHRLRFINPSSFAVIVVSIDHHDMTVIANDFVPVVPYKATTLTLAAGQRNDVLVTAKPEPATANSAYWLRVRQPTLCALANQPFGLAAIYYNSSNVNTDAQPISLPQADFISPRLLDCANDPLGDTEPFYPIAAREPDTTVTIDITQIINETGHGIYAMNGQSFRANYNNPGLRAVQAGDVSFEHTPNQNVYNFGSNQTIRIIFQNKVPFTHPMHVHGQNMYVLDEGVGTLDGETIIRPENPQRRDTQILQPDGYLVVQLESNNPGVWPFHCHFAWHVSQGLYINVVQKPEEVEKLTQVPGILKDTCDAWQQFTDSTIVDEIDSGVKMRMFMDV